MATLASNFSDQGVIAGLVLGSLAFLIQIALALSIARRQPGGAGLAALVWAIAYPPVQLTLVFQATHLFPIEDGPIAAVLWLVIPSVISAGVLGWCTRSWIPLCGVAAGVAATLLMWRAIVPSAWVAIPWNICCGGSLMVWAWRARPVVSQLGHCVRCGYDLRQTQGPLCPECGGMGTWGDGNLRRRGR